MNTANIDAGKAISYGWASVKKDFWYLVGIAVVSQIISNFFGGGDRDSNNWDILGFFLTAWMTCGYIALLLSYQAGHKLPFENLFTQWKYFWRILGATILLGLIFVGGLILFIIPGIYWALKYQMTMNLIIDKNMGIGEAMRESARLTQGKKMSLLGFDLMCLGVILLGVLALGVGVFVAMPVVWLAGIVVYRQLGQSAPAAA